MVDVIEARWGAVNGVIHAAGVTTGKSFAPIAALTPSAFEEQLLPKMAGARVLADVFAGRPLDFCSFTSSVSTVLGGLGFGAYAGGESGHGRCRLPSAPERCGVMDERGVGRLEFRR